MKTTKPIVFAAKPILILLLFLISFWLIGRDSELRQKAKPVVESSEVEVLLELDTRGETPAIEEIVMPIAEEYSDFSKSLIAAIEDGRVISVYMGDRGTSRYHFWPREVTTEEFHFSRGIREEEGLVADFATFRGRSIGDGFSSGAPASLAIVNDAVSLQINVDGKDYMVEQDAAGELVALQTPEFSDDSILHHGACNGSCSHDGEVAVTRVSGYNPAAMESFPVTLNFESNQTPPTTTEAGVDHFHYRLGKQYDASLRDIVILWISSKVETGPSSGLNARAASYLATAGRVADAYERQLGLRYILQELVLLPSDSSQPDVANTNLGNSDLERLQAWLDLYRPKNSFRWGHATAWTPVNGALGGTVGTAYLDAYGNGNFSTSVQERAFGWRVHSHEFGHNVGASHSVGGIMNSSLSGNTEDFYTESLNGSYTAAKDISNYMGADPNALSDMYGPATLRDAAEIPFAIDDTMFISGGNSGSLSPLGNDEVMVNFGVTNDIRLVEVGAVFPKAAGSVTINSGDVVFTPANGFTGLAYFTYTISGNQGNGGVGWLHSADVTVSVDSSTNPSLTPALTTESDFLTSGFSAPIRVNPLLNDEATGQLWPGDVEVRSGVSQASNPAWEDRAFRLISAFVTQGTGLITLETRPMIRNGSYAESNSGYIIYNPGSNEGNLVILSYTVEDANGVRATDTIQIQRAAEVTILASKEELISTTGDLLEVTIRRNQIAPTNAPEIVNIEVTGDAILAGANADFGIAGPVDFNPITGNGTVVIPAGETDVDLFIVPSPRSQAAPDRFSTIRITGSSSLAVSSISTVTFRLAVLEDIFVDDLEDASTSGNWSTTQSRPGGGTWRLRNGASPTPNTGANGGFPEAAGKYLDVTIDGAIRPSSTNVFSRFLNLSSLTSGRLTFAYHMWGANVGTLSLDLYTGGSWVENVLVYNGQQSVNGDDWKIASVDLANYLSSDFRIRFKYVLGNGLLGDIAIDDIKVRGVRARASSALSVRSPIGNKAVEIGSPLYMAAAVDGFPSPQYRWFRNGSEVSGVTSAAYFDSSFGQSDIGSYAAEVSSGNSVVSLSAWVVDAATAGPDYQEWIAINGASLSAAERVGTADPDGDGLTNFVEFAYGSDPLSSSASVLISPKVKRMATNSVASPVFEFRRRVGGAYGPENVYFAAGVEYVVEENQNLSATGWTPVDQSANLGIIPLGGGVESVRVQLFNTAQTKNFMRLKLQDNP